MHFRITLAFFVLDGRCGVDNRCIHNGAAPHHESCLLKTLFDVVEDGFSDIVFFQQVPKLQQGGRIRNLFLQEIDSYEVPHSVAVVDRILETFVRQVEPNLKQIYPEHYFDPARRTAALPLGIVQKNLVDPVGSWNDVIHFPKELFLLSDTLPSAVFHVAESHLIHTFNPLYLLASWYFYYTIHGVEALLKILIKSVFP